MKKTVIANMLTPLSIWIAALPVFFVLYAASGDEIVSRFKIIHSDLPKGSVFLVHHLNSANWAVLTVLVSAGVLVGRWQIREEQTRFIFQLWFIVLWQLAALGILYGRALPLFPLPEIINQ